MARELTPEEKQTVERLLRLVKSMTWLTVIVVSFVVFRIFHGPIDWEPGSTTTAEQQLAPTPDSENVVDGIDQLSGLIAADGYEVVRANCTACHSAKLVTQNRASREGWLEIIRWMQETQKLWDLGENEALILDYLATNYAPEATGRRKPLTTIEWYELEE